MPLKAQQETGAGSLEGAVYRRVFQFSELFHFIYSIYAAAALISMPLFGGALYLMGRMTVHFSDRIRPPRSEELSGTEKITGSLVLVLLSLLLLYILMLTPGSYSLPHLWTMLLLAAALTLRNVITVRLLEKQLLEGSGNSRHFRTALLVQALLFLPVFVLLVLFSDIRTVLALSVGYAVGNIWEFHELWRDRERLRTWNRADREELDALRSVHSYRIFQNVAVAVSFAIQVTTTVMVAAFGITDREILYRLLTTFAVSLICAEAVELLMKRKKAREQDPITMMVTGLGLWLYSLILFYRNLPDPRLPAVYLNIALCTAGSTVCVRVLSYLEGKMRNAAAFAIGREAVSAYDWLLRSRMELSGFAGQTFSVALLAAIWIFGGPGTAGAGTDRLVRLRPLMLLPAVIPVSAALLMALRFPITARHLQKLERYLRMIRNGEENEALRRQLENVIVRKSLRRYGIRILIMVIRPWYRHRLIGRERVDTGDETPCVFVCNHGELYGPVVTALYMPFHYRPWVTSEMADRRVISDYIYRNTFSKVRWMPDGFARVFCTGLAGPVVAWIMRSMDCIPVYHGNTRQLMNTFRATVDAMEAGDNILVFPENSATSADGRFLREGVSEFFSGFAVIGQLYYKRTGKNCRFVPIYADKQRRVISFGHEARYDGEANPAEEKTRLSQVLRDEMLRMHEGKGD